MPRKATGGKNGRPPRNVLPPKQAKAVELEARYRIEHAELPKPRYLTDRLDVSRQAISKWRKDPLYLESRDRWIQQLDHERDRVWAAQLLERLEKKDGDKDPARAEALARLTRNRRVYIEQYVNRHWTGPVEQPGGSHVFQNPREYVEYIMSSASSLPFEIVEDAIAAHIKSGNSRK